MERIITAAIALAAATFSYAGSFTDNTSLTAVFSAPGTPIGAIQEDEKTPVRMEDLPAAVRKSLQDAEHEGWTPYMAYWIREGKSSYYEVELAKDKDRKVVKLNDKGARII